MKWILNIVSRFGGGLSQHLWVSPLWLSVLQLLSTSLTAADSMKGVWPVEKNVICFILHSLLLNSGLEDQLLSSVQLWAGFTNRNSFKLGVVVNENHPISTSSFPLTKAPEAVSKLAHICTEFVSFPPDQLYPCNWLSVKPNYNFLITETSFWLITTPSYEF